MDKITEKNYYGHEADIGYMSASQLKKFRQCEAEAMAELNGLYKPPESDALAIGRYMDALWDDDPAMDKLMLADRPKYCKKDGSKRAPVIAADNAYERAYSDPMFREFMSGEHQTILTGEIAGVPFKGKMDSYFPGDKIVDLKYMADINPKYKDGERMDFLTFYGYDIQLSIYQNLESQQSGTGELLPCYIAVITKESTPRIALIEVPQWKLNSSLEVVKHYAPIYQEIKEGKREPKRCEKCDYCRETHKIEKPMKYEDLLVM